MVKVIRMKELRARHGLTQQDLAREIGVKQPSVSNWETGYCTPSVACLRKMAKVFKVRMDEIEIQL